MLNSFKWMIVVACIINLIMTHKEIYWTKSYTIGTTLLTYQILDVSYHISTYMCQMLSIGSQKDKESEHWIMMYVGSCTPIGPYGEPK